MEILSTSNNYLALIVIILVLFWSYVFLHRAILEKRKNNKWQSIICALVSISICISGTLLCLNEFKKKKLKVIITNISEIDINKYKIVGNEGKIIKLKEK